MGRLGKIESNLAGFTLLELLVVIAIIGIIGAMAIPAFSGYYGAVCTKSAAFEIAALMREGKQLALGEQNHALIFDTASGSVSLVADGGDGHWNSADDRVLRSLRLRDKGGGVGFGYGACGPIPGRAEAADGISFQNNRMVCNERLTGNAGAVYLRSEHGTTMAVVMNSEAFTYKLWQCQSGSWGRL